VELFCILASFACVVATYVYVSRRERSYLHILTPTFAFLVPANYLLELYHLYLYGPSASPFAYALMYSCYAVTFTAFALGYVKTRVPALRLPFTVREAAPNGFVPYLVLAAAVALYAPVLIEFKGILNNPRQIYEQTRTGYGVYFFLSTTVCYLALLLLLFKRRLGRVELALFSMTCLVFLWLHGSKGQMLLVVFIVAMYWVYLRGNRLSLARFAVFGAVLGGVGLVLFMLTNPAILVNREGLQGVSAYSDYTRNGMLVIDSSVGPLYGKLSLEQQIYSRVPRPLFPDKPEDFGALYLAEHFFPAKFQAQSGAPAFSFGIEFADFGVLALPFLLLESFVGGMMLNAFMQGLRRHRGPGDFLMVLFAAGLPLIPLSGAFLLPESLILAVAANILYGMRLKPRRVLEPDHQPAGGNA
jgi:O-antigen polymerase